MAIPAWAVSQYDGGHGSEAGCARFLRPCVGERLYLFGARPQVFRNRSRCHRQSVAELCPSKPSNFGHFVTNWFVFADLRACGISRKLAGHHRVASADFPLPCGEKLSIVCDVSRPEQIAKVAEKVLDRFGRCDIFVNNAAVFPITDLKTITLDVWRRVQAVNVEPHR
jgi:Enoyl-(Acyl carrier protein) reductase